MISIVMSRLSYLPLTLDDNFVPVDGAEFKDFQSPTPQTITVSGLLEGADIVKVATRGSITEYRAVIRTGLTAVTRTPLYSVMTRTVGTKEITKDIAYAAPSGTIFVEKIIRKRTSNGSVIIDYLVIHGPII